MFVEIDSTGNETKIYTPGYYLPQSLTYAGDVIAWLNVNMIQDGNIEITP